MAYEPLIYKTSGGDVMVVSTGGVLDIRGTLQLTTGATLTLAGQTITSTGAGTFNSVTSTGTGTFNAVTSTGVVSGRYIQMTGVETASSGSTGFGSQGVTDVWSSGTSTGHLFTMPVAAQGYQKWITGGGGAVSTAPVTVTIAGTLINGSANISFSTGGVNPQWIHLFAQNSTNWVVISKSTDVTIS